MAGSRTEFKLFSANMWKDLPIPHRRIIPPLNIGDTMTKLSSIALALSL